MDFSQTYFDKDLDILTAEDLIRLFKSNPKESQYLEFKSSGEPHIEQVFNKSLKPAICSFLNSEGGILIFGAPREEKRNSDYPFQGEFTPYQKDFLGDHDTIIRKISDGITPMPIGIRLKEIEFPDGYVAVFQIQESRTKPHQTGNIYQIRIDGQKKPAPHYLIEAMMKQVQWPELNGLIRFSNYEKQEAFHIFNLKFVLTNKTHSQNAKNIELILKCAIRSQVISHNTGTIPFVSSGLSQSMDFKIEIENNLFQDHTDTNIEFALIFVGENTKPKITYYKIKIPPAYGKEIIYEHHFTKISENLGIDEFVQKHLDQRVITKL